MESLCLGEQKEIQEVKNAYEAYEKINGDRSLMHIEESESTYMGL